MKPKEALYQLINYGPAYVPAFYRKMERAQLETLVRECDKPTAEQRSEAALTHWAQQRLKMPAWVDMNEPPKDKPEAEATAPLPAADPVPEEPRTLADRAILKPERLSTPRRRQSAFLSHFARCRTVIEAAARTGVDQRTVHRWRQNAPCSTRSAATSLRRGVGRRSRMSYWRPTMSRSGRCSIAAGRSQNTPGATGRSTSIS